MRSARVLAVGLALALAGCGAQPPRADPPAPAKIDVGGHPGRIALGEGALWVTASRDRAHHRVIRIDPATSRIVASIPVKGAPFAIAAGEGAVWVTGNFDDGGDVLYRIDPETNRLAATIDLPGDYAGPVAAGAGAVWQVITERGRTRSSLVRIDPSTNHVAGAAAVEAADGRYLDDLAVGLGSVWVLALKLGATGELPGDVLRVDPATGRTVAVIGAEALSMGVGPGGVWVTGCLDCGVHRKRFFAQRIDVEANAPVGPRVTFDAGVGPLLVGADAVWLSGYDSEQNTIALRLDPKRGEIDRTVRATAFLHSGTAIDPGERTLWVAVAPGSVLRVDLAGR